MKAYDIIVLLPSLKAYHDYIINSCISIGLQKQAYGRLKHIGQFKVGLPQSEIAVVDVVVILSRPTTLFNIGVLL